MVRRLPGHATSTFGSDIGGRRVSVLARTAGLVGLAVLAGAALAVPAAAQSEAPAGNNGTIKIDDVPSDDGNENVPHPGCTFVIDFFGYDVGTRNAVLTFEGQDPTGGGTLLVEDITFEVATRDSGNQLNESHVVDLTSALVGIAPHPKQGWHVKLTVNVDGAQGADVKHKTFWVAACDSPVLTAQQAAVDLEHDTQVWAEALAANVEAQNAAAAANVEAQNAAAAANLEAQNAAAAANANVEAPATPAPAASTGELPRTGSATGFLVVLAMGLIGCGTVAVAVAKRRTGMLIAR